MKRYKYLIFDADHTLIDFEAEKKRLTKELESCERQLAGVEAKLNNESFLSKAPEQVVQNQRDLAAKHQEKIAMLRESLAKLSK